MRAPEYSREKVSLEMCESSLTPLTIKNAIIILSYSETVFYLMILASVVPLLFLGYYQGSSVSVKTWVLCFHHSCQTGETTPLDDIICILNYYSCRKRGFCLCREIFGKKCVLITLLWDATFGLFLWLVCLLGYLGSI